MSYLGINIKKIRKSKGFSIAELAKASKTSPATISQIENGKRDATFKVIFSLAQALGVEIAILVTPPYEQNYTHSIEPVISFLDSTFLIVGCSKNNFEELYWGGIFYISSESENEISLVETLYPKGNDKYDFKHFYESRLQDYLYQKKLWILLWKQKQKQFGIDKKYTDVKKNGIPWEYMENIITHLGFLGFKE